MDAVVVGAEDSHPLNAFRPIPSRSMRRLIRYRGGGKTPENRSKKQTQGAAAATVNRRLGHSHVARPSRSIVYVHMGRSLTVPDRARSDNTIAELIAFRAGGNDRKVAPVSKSSVPSRQSSSCMRLSRKTAVEQRKVNLDFSVVVDEALLADLFMKS